MQRRSPSPVVVLSIALAAACLPVAAEGPAAPVMRCVAEVSVAAPATGLVDVRLELPAEMMAGRGHLDVGFAAARQFGSALRRIEAHAGARRLAVIDPDPDRPYIKRILRPPGVGRTTLRYTIDPTYFPPGHLLNPGYAHSRVTARLGVLRTSALFPRFAAPDRPAADVTFRLPPGWRAVTPWPVVGAVYRLTPEQFAATDYVGIGPFKTTQLPVGASRFRLGALAEAAALPLETVVALVHGVLEVVQQPLPGRGVLSALVVPQEFMSGGSAGGSSVVQPPWPEVLAHEMFHWWNDADLTGEDAAWFREGLSEYYGLRIARAVRAVSDERARACLADMEAEVRLLDGDDPVSLAAASRAFENDAARRIAYSKGALFGLVLERYLETHDRHIDEAVRAVLASGGRALDSEEIGAIFGRVYGGLTDRLFRRFVRDGAALPDLSLPVATGESGCARFVPRRLPAPAPGPRRDAAPSRGDR